jgi:hypothetical protein
MGKDEPLVGGVRGGGRTVIKLRDLLHPPPVHAEVIIPCSGGRPEMNNAGRIIERKLHIIYKAEEGGTEFHMEVRRGG